MMIKGSKMFPNTSTNGGGAANEFNRRDFEC
jgi:hypothetical protein